MEMNWRVRRRLRQLRIERALTRADLGETVIWAYGYVRISLRFAPPRGLWSVWTISPRRGYARVVSVWTDRESAESSAYRLHLTMRRRCEEAKA